ncbi:MAG TPA: hypothetical protein VMH32_06035 [Burkholderiales bacterium]|nr:hypothetical protein [Burkholderiales bacterium]
MTEGPDDSGNARSGLVNVLKLIGAIAILVLALLGVLVVLDVVPRDALGELATKIVLVACIFGLASAALALLMRPGKQ